MRASCHTSITLPSTSISGDIREYGKIRTSSVHNLGIVLSTCCFVYTMIEQSCVLDVVHRTGHLVFKRIVGLRVLYIYSFAFNLAELGECTRIRGE